VHFPGVTDESRERIGTAIQGAIFESSAFFGYESASLITKLRSSDYIISIIIVTIGIGTSSDASSMAGPELYFFWRISAFFLGLLNQTRKILGK